MARALIAMLIDKRYIGALFIRRSFLQPHELQQIQVDMYALRVLLLATLEGHCHMLCLGGVNSADMCHLAAA